MKKVLTRIFWLAFSMILLNACDNSNPSAPPELSGTAATGKGIAGTVIVKDANGVEVNVATGADGSYSVLVPDMTPPFLVKVMPNDGTATLYSFANAANETVNITPLTNLAVFLASGNANLDDVYTGWKGKALTETAVVDAQKKINANLQAKLTAAGLDAKTFDFRKTAFTADGSGIDGVLDTIKLAVDFAKGVIASFDVDGKAFSFNNAIDVAGFDFASNTPATTTDSTGGGTSTSFSDVPQGTVKFSGVDAANLLSGDTFTPGVGVVTQGDNPPGTPAGTFYQMAWTQLVSGGSASDGNGTIITYRETTDSATGSVTRSVLVNSSDHKTLTFYNYQLFDLQSNELPGVSVDKATNTITFSNAVLTGGRFDTSGAVPNDTLTLNGSLTAQ